MLTDAEVKKQLIKDAGTNPDKFYPVITLKQYDFSRSQCSKCSRHYWRVEKGKANVICGDPACSGGFRFIGNSPCKKKLDYIQVWKEFERIHEKLGYTSVKRYPVISRWNPTTDFTIASIAAFQPYVVSGEISPPANPLIIPQFCLRFPDVDNVGITGHNSGFVMMGQHAFVTPKDYDVNKYLRDHLTWLTDGVGVPIEELTVHEDAWAGGGNSGPSMEFFARGLELSNQVYMQYEITESGLKELSIKVLDMGEGQERVAWFTSGKASVYETSFPIVIEKLKRLTGVVADEELMKRFVPLSPYLNCNEIDDLDEAWRQVAGKLGMDAGALRDKIGPLAGLYSVAEHSRALLFALSDGGLPSNVGGMYNLRVILRRALGFIEKYKWGIDLADVCEWHAEYLKPLYPELSLQLANIRKILTVERDKYLATLQKSKELAIKLAGTGLTTDRLIELYDSQGISPELIAEEARKQGKQMRVPNNFYGLVAERHKKERQDHETKREATFELKGIPATRALYFDSWDKSEFSAKVQKVSGNLVILDETIFYPTSGGQLHDNGAIAGIPVIDVFKQGNVIVHQLAKDAPFKEGETVFGKIDFDRRKQLSQHHSATHIVTAVSREILGPHVNQAGAKKDVDKAHIDLTHYQTIAESELRVIEKRANDIIQQKLVIKKSFLPRQDAERLYGMAIYQGGAVPGKVLRIVEIQGLDVEACGGTHLDNTKEVEQIKVIKSSKIKDGIVRLEFAAGHAASLILYADKQIIDEAAKLLDCKVSQVPGRAQELFDNWKKARKLLQKKETIPEEMRKLVSVASYDGDILAKSAEILQTQPEHICKTIKRFIDDIA